MIEEVNEGLGKVSPVGGIVEVGMVIVHYIDQNREAFCIPSVTHLLKVRLGVGWINPVVALVNVQYVFAKLPVRVQIVYGRIGKGGIAILLDSEDHIIALDFAYKDL